MKTIRPITDYLSIVSLLAKDDLYQSIVDDGSVPLLQYSPDSMSGKERWFMLLEGTEPAGFIRMDYFNHTTLACHIGIFKEFRGKGSEEWGTQAIEYARKYLGAKKFITWSPYTAGVKYATRVGFKEVFTMDNAISIGGAMRKLTFMEME